MVLKNRKINNKDLGLEFKVEHKDDPKVQQRIRFGTTKVKDLHEQDREEAVVVIFGYDYALYTDPEDYDADLKPYSNKTVAQAFRQESDYGIDYFIYDIKRINRILNTEINNLTPDELTDAFMYVNRFKPVKGSLAKFKKEYGELLVGEAFEMSETGTLFVNLYMQEHQMSFDMSREIERLCSKSD